MLFLLLNHLFILRCPQTAHARDHIIQSSQEETKEEKDKKQFRLPIQEVEETQRKNDCNNRIVLSKGNNTIHKSSEMLKNFLTQPLYHIVSIRAA
jgi:hypothetical protein